MTDVVFIEKDILLAIVDKLGILSNDIDEDVEFIVDKKEFFCQDLQELKKKTKDFYSKEELHLKKINLIFYTD